MTTSLNRAVILLDSKFEGSFDLHALNGSVLVTDLDGDAQFHTQSFYDIFPDVYYKRSLELQHDSPSRVRGCVKRDGRLSSRGADEKVTVPSPDGGPTANVIVNNNMSLVALGFLQPSQTSPILKDLGLS